MKEFPILFSTPMVQSIISGNKTQTRRTRGLEKVNENPDEYSFFKYEYNEKEKKCAVFSFKKNIALKYRLDCPYGKPGDLLWVREKFKSKYIKGCLNEFKIHYPNNHPWIYAADGESEKGYGTWKPSIHMPKEAARIWLRITDIRVERLHAISEEDAIAEGGECGIFRYGPNLINNDYHIELNIHASYIDGFKFIWHQINGKDSWISNPWVWVVTFERRLPEQN